jgi:hypothetical protein
MQSSKYAVYISCVRMSYTVTQSSCTTAGVIVDAESVLIDVDEIENTRYSTQVEKMKHEQVTRCAFIGGRKSGAHIITWKRLFSCS